MDSLPPTPPGYANVQQLENQHSREYFPAHLPKDFQFGSVFWVCSQGGESECFSFTASPPTSWAHPLLLQVLLHLFLFFLVQDVIPILVKPGEGGRELSDLMLCVPQSEENSMMK